MTRARTTRPPVVLTQPTTPTTTTTTPAPDVDDYGSTVSAWPELIDPVPTFWPTSNWWGSIERTNDRRNNQIPSDPYNNRQREKAGRTGSARSSGSRPAPYFQLLLAGLVQVRGLVAMTLPIVLLACSWLAAPLA